MSAGSMYAYSSRMLKQMMFFPFNADLNRC